MWAMHAGPMLHGASQVLFEGVPTHPDAGRAWDIVDKYKVRGGMNATRNIVWEATACMSSVLPWQCLCHWGVGEAGDGCR